MTPLRTVRAHFHSTHQLKVSPLLTLEIASTPEQQHLGLMGRAVLPPHYGMLFAFSSPGKHGFWMKNTSIPIDLAWLSAAGVVQETARLIPHDERMHLPRAPAKYAIELAADSFNLYDVRVGDKLQLVLGEQQRLF